MPVTVRCTYRKIFWLLLNLNTNYLIRMNDKLLRQWMALIWYWKVRQTLLDWKREREQQFLTPSLNYLPCSIVFVKSTYESAWLEEEAVSKRDLLAANAGLLGAGRDAVSLPSMRTTLDMVGRSHGCSCTHWRPTFTHLTNSFASQVSHSARSIKSRTFFPFHNLHACDRIKNQNY